MGDALLKRACIIPAFLDYNMLVVNFKGMEEELFLCEGGGEIDWDMGSFMWDAEGGAGAPFPLGWVMYRIGNLCQTRNLEQSSFSAGMGGVWDLGNLCRTRNLERELLFRWI